MTQAQSQSSQSSDGQAQDTLESKQPPQPPQSGPYAGYSEQARPLGGYAALMGVYGVAAATLYTAAQAGRGLPKNVPPYDLLLLGLATHKLSRIIALDWVVSPLRAPFTHYEGSSGSGEVKEKARGQGLRKAIGELVTCPWCMGPWVALGLTGTYVLNPPAGRALAGIFTIVAMSDFLHHVYGAAKKLGK